MFTVNMEETFVSIEGSCECFETFNRNYHIDHRAYKFQLAVDVIFHKAVITVPVYPGDASSLEDVNRQLINLVEVYEHNGSGWVFSNFASLQLTL